MKNAHKWIDAIIDSLFAPDNRRFQAWIDKIAKKHQEYIKSMKPAGFIYAGVFYRPSDLGIIDSKRALHSSLAPEMEMFLADKRQVDSEKAFIRQALFPLLEPCNSLPDIRDALPECLVDTLPDLNGYPRTREVAFTIQGNTRALRHFQKMLPKMEEYSAARLMF